MVCPCDRHRQLVHDFALDADEVVFNSLGEDGKLDCRRIRKGPGDGDLERGRGRKACPERQIAS